MHSLSIRALVPLVGLLCGCIEFRQTPGVLFSSAPSGARIVVDGVDSGFVTPRHLDLSRERHDVDLVLEGYTPTSVRIDAGGEIWLIHWDEAWVNAQTWRFPLWLNARDGLFPIKVENSYGPSRIHARLKLIEGSDRPRRETEPEASEGERRGGG
jgi:hypothetical protein